MRLSKSRLGELLVNSKAITEDQLILAIKYQKLSDMPLGQLLVAMGFINPATLWKTLAKQTSLRVATACLTLFIGVSSMGFAKSARADTFSSQKTQVQTASIMNVPNFSKGSFKKEPLFGSAEKRSTNMKAFTKWNDAVRKHNVSFSSNDNWANDIQRFQGLNEVDQIRKVNSYVNQVRYVEDNRLWNKSDYWATPAEFFARGAGDCEDFAIAKYHALKMLGFSKDQMRLVVVQDTIKNIPHAILVVYTQNGSYILDNQEKTAKKAERVSRYKPIYSINETAWWRHSS